MYIEMPLSREVRETYPREYEIGEMAVRKIEKRFKVKMPRGEAAGIAMHFVNAARLEDAEGEVLNDDLLQGVVEIVERDMNVSIERDTFDFARFATHVNYLLDRMRDGKPFDTRNGMLAAAVAKELPREMACVDDIAAYLKDKLGVDMTEEERIYIALHVTRVCDRLKDPNEYFTL
jgi:beta-glucoside operon transcriptional antiterminator